MALTTNEQSELQEHEQMIEQGLKTFVDVGNALLAIRDGRLYRVEYGTFDAYCQKRWGFVSRQAERLILASRTVQNLRPIGRKLPTSEYQARPLTKLEPEQQREVWASVVQEAQETGERITGAKVKDMVARAILDDKDYEPEEWEDAEICGWLAAYNAQGLDVCRYSGNEVIGTECGPHCQYYVIDAPGIDSEHPVASQQVQVTIFSHKTVEYYTPPKYIEAAREVLGTIDLDPASCEAAQAMVKAERFYTKDDDGLQREWFGHLWLNPPYSKTAGKSNQGIWSHHLANEYRQGNVQEAILLVKAALGYKWFEKLWCDWPVCFARERLSFIKADGTNNGQSKQGTAFIYFGPNPQTFKSVFREFGRVIMPEEK